MKVPVRETAKEKALVQQHDGCAQKLALVQAGRLSVEEEDIKASWEALLQQRLLKKVSQLVKVSRAVLAHLYSAH